MRLSVLNRSRVLRRSIGRGEALEIRRESGIARRGVAPAPERVGRARAAPADNGCDSGDGDTVALDHEGLTPIANPAEDVAQLARQGGRRNDVLHNYVLYVNTY